MARIIYVAVSILLGLQAVASLPTADVVYPEFIPGPGLPTLAELGLTIAELHNMKLDYNVTEVARSTGAFRAECGPTDDYYVPVDGIVVCYKFLMALGSYKLSVGSGLEPVLIAQSGSSPVYAQGLAVTSTIAANAAGGVLWVLNSCTRPDGSIAGIQTATGNSDFLVEVG